MDEHARRMIAGAVNGGGVPVGGPPREMVQLQNPDGSTVMVTTEQATLHMVMEIRQIVADVRSMIVNAEVVSMEAEQITREADGGADTEATG